MLKSLLAVLSRFRPLFKWPALPGWVVVAWEIVDHSSRIDFVVGKGWHMLRGVFAFLAEHPNLRLLIGLGWLTLVVLVPKDWPSKLRARFSSKNKARESGGIQCQGTGTVGDPGKQVTQNCSDERLHRWANDDRHSAWRMVKFTAVMAELHIAPSGPPPYIIFTFSIFSLTLREVSVKDEIGGFVEFKVPEHESWRLRRGIAMEYNEARQVLFRGSYFFKVRQDLTREDADYIRDNLETGSFKMDELVVRIAGDGLDDPRLDTRFSVKVNEYYQPTLSEFLFPTVQG
jgi:hypothetical protein